MISFLRRCKQSLQIVLVVCIQIVQVLDLISVGLLFTLACFRLLFDDILNLFLQALDILIVLLACRFKICNVLAHFILTLLCHERLAHSISNRTFVKSLIGLDGHLNFIADSNKQEAALCTVDSDLTDQFVEALGEELLTEWADSGFTGLASLNRGVQVILQVDHVDLSGGLGRNVTDPEGAGFSVLARRQNRVQIVLVPLLLVLSCLFHLISWRSLLFLGLLVGDRSRNENRVIVSDERVGWLLRHSFNFNYYFKNVFIIFSLNINLLDRLNLD